MFHSAYESHWSPVVEVNQAESERVLEKACLSSLSEFATSFVLLDAPSHAVFEHAVAVSEDSRKEMFILLDAPSHAVFDHAVAVSEDSRKEMFVGTSGRRSMWTRTPINANCRHWFATSCLQPLPSLTTP